jgi:isoquinoline 1-oxidoreductase beta subunit
MISEAFAAEAVRQRNSASLAILSRATAADWDRRGFLKGLGGAAGLIIAFRCGAGPLRGASAVKGAASPRTGGPFMPNAFVRITSDGIVTVIVNHSEMGQGISTALPMLVAEELDADWASVRTQFAPADPAYNHALFGIQMTGGSTSTWTEYERLRGVGATARALLVQAAADEWKANLADCRTRSGEVLHADGRHIAYGALVGRAAELSPPARVALKDPKNFRLIGQPTLRRDSADKVTGRAEFGLDIRLPGLLVALVARAPVFGGTLQTFDPAPALAVAGVRRVIPVPSGVAVIADGFWPALCGRRALAPTLKWNLPPASLIDSEEQAAEYQRRSREAGAVAAKSGDVAAALQAAAQVVQADYAVPYLAHAPMEPLNATVRLIDGGAEIWSGTQFQTVDRAAAAAVLQIAPERVTLHTPYLGGGFGRRATPASDWIVEAVHVARAAQTAGVNAPIKTIWTREDDLAGGYYRPMFHHRLVGGIDADGKVTAWHQSIVGQSFLVGTPFAAMIKHGVDDTSVEGAADAPYQIPHRLVEVQNPTIPVPTLWWRSVGHSHTALAVECFLDELAHAAGKDPLELRRQLLPADSRERRALELAVAKSGYGAAKLPAGHFHGLAVHQSFGSYVGQVAEVSVVSGKLTVHRLTVAVDCGTVVNPLTVEAQIQGAAIYALSALYYGEISLRAGRVQQGNFDRYRVMRVFEAPVVDVHIIARGDKMGGIGETGVPPTFASVLNGVFAATGQRVRTLPLSRSGWV